ncbi:interferon regulatory factor 6-like isoform X2 [Oscarella lobularis]|uniref:interferon regulatory factor 6-like isoform X2 n=1 Tax=Oscarella lobularis TaxID=121494 RepID=UPI0033143BB2
MEPKKQRMLPWLWHRLEERSIHGLEWVARDQFMFRMPWVHAKKKSYDVSRDAALYKQWAINSGKYVAHRDIADPTTWKINFRCALNSLKGHIDCLRVDEIDGFRYYQFNKQALHEQLEADQNRLYQRRSSDLSPGGFRRSPASTPGPTPSPGKTPMSLFGHPGPMTSRAPMSLPPPLPPMSQFDSNAGLVHEQLMTPPRDGDESPPLSSASSHHGQSEHPQATRSPDSGKGDDSSKDQDDELIEELEIITRIVDALRDPDSAKTMTDSHEMEVVIFYQSKEVARHRVTNPKGCRIGYNPQGVKPNIGSDDFRKLFGEPERTQINLPDPVNASRDMMDVLNAMQRGLLLDMKHNDMFAVMLGRCSVYCNDTRVETSERGKLNRIERTKVFDYRTLFKPSFEKHRKYHTGCPSQELYFTFGQTWSNDRLPEENLLSIAVVHSRARAEARSLANPPHPIASRNNDRNANLELFPRTPEDDYAHLLLAPIPKLSSSSSTTSSTTLQSPM